MIKLIFIINERVTFKQNSQLSLISKRINLLAFLHAYSLVSF